jgi:hypothetical protein
MTSRRPSKNTATKASRIASGNSSQCCFYGRLPHSFGVCGADFL